MSQPLVKINVMPHRSKNGASDLRPVYHVVCPDCQNSRQVTRVSSNGMRWLSRCTRCEAIR